MTRMSTLDHKDVRPVCRSLGAGQESQKSDVKVIRYCCSRSGQLWRSRPCAEGIIFRCCRVPCNMLQFISHAVGTWSPIGFGSVVSRSLPLASLLRLLFGSLFHTLHESLDCLTATHGHASAFDETSILDLHLQSFANHWQTAIA